MVSPDLVTWIFAHSLLLALVIGRAVFNRVTGL